jgi:hypothetical protein
MEKVCSLNQAEKLVALDPVRPHIPATTRISMGRQIFHIQEKAVICLAFSNRIPTSEKQLLESEIGPVAIAYSIWSLQKGLGKQIMKETIDFVKTTKRITRLLTFSPKTDIATQFHIGNGAVLVANYKTANIFEYKRIY